MSRFSAALSLLMHDWPTSWDSALASAAGEAVARWRSVRSRTHFERAIRKAPAIPSRLPTMAFCCGGFFNFARAKHVFEQVVEDPRADPADTAASRALLFRDRPLRQSRRSDARGVGADGWPGCRDDQHVGVDTRARSPNRRGHAITRKRPTQSTSRTVRPCGFWRIWTVALANLERAEGRLTEQLRRYPSDFDWGLNYELASVLDRLGKYDAAWSALCQAKSQLAERSGRSPSRDSYFIRRRQWEHRAVSHGGGSAALATGRRLVEPPKRIAFLTGFPRSGTTLLEQIIASHADAIDTDESGILPGQFIEPLCGRPKTRFPPSSNFARLTPSNLSPAVKHFSN